MLIFSVRLHVDMNVGVEVAIVFFNHFFFMGTLQGLDGQSDPNSIHGGCEVLGGEKWSATKWMRQKSTLVATT